MPVSSVGRHLGNMGFNQNGPTLQRGHVVFRVVGSWGKNGGMRKFPGCCLWEVKVKCLGSFCALSHVSHPGGSNLYRWVFLSS